MNITINTKIELDEFVNRHNTSYEIVYLAVHLRNHMGSLFEDICSSITTDLGTYSTTVNTEFGKLHFIPEKGIGKFTLSSNRKPFSDLPYNGLHIAIPFKEIVLAFEKSRNAIELTKRQFASAKFAWSLQLEFIKSELDDEGIPFKSGLIDVHLEKSVAKSEGFLGGFSIYRNENIRDLKKIKLGDSFILELQVFGRTCGTAKFKAISWKNAKQIILALRS